MRIYQNREIMHMFAVLQQLNAALGKRLKIENFQSQVCVCAASTNLTCEKGYAEIGLNMENIQAPDRNQLLVECQEWAIKIGTKVEEIEKKAAMCIKDLEEYCEDVYQISTGLTAGEMQKKIADMDQLLRNAILDIEKNTDKKLKILFLPYKADMWMSFDSIWKCADEDPEAEVTVVPIPYYKFGIGNVKLIYEGGRFPDTVLITPWEEYEVQKEKPDLIFIHNPYDDGNNLTRVQGQYFSAELKHHTGGLVYSPYFTMGGYTKGKSDFQYVNKGTIYADKVIVQSEFVKKIYESYGYPPEKLVALGSPKIDAVVNYKKQNPGLPDRWKAKLEGRKIFLLNTHLSYFPAGAGNVSRYGFDYAKRYHDELLDAMIDKEGCGMIWRPHPLLFDMIEARFPECREYVENMKKRIEMSSNCVMDEYSDYRISFFHSDALITTYSSMIHEYMVTGKPVLIFQTKPTEEGGQRSPIDMRTCYFKFKKDGGMSFKHFIEMVAEGEDPKYEERMEMLKRRSFANMDGCAGRKIYDYLKEWIMS
ncbi:MAG: hypothetical protein HFI00_12705 [Lachnospiraceae bacterium]|nr:hypothetical protein [Lachnospiraceae bacterium]